MLSLEQIFLSFQIAVLAWVYTEILTEPKEVLGWWCKWLHKVIKNEFLLKPLCDCPYCVAGQLSLWGYLYFNWDTYNLISHLLFIGMGIFMIILLKTTKRIINE